MENETCSLENKTCVPCSGTVPALTSPEIKNFFTQLKGSWKLNTAGHLYKEFTFKDFMGAMNLANKIAQIAEKEAHHPDIAIAWGKCSVEIWTHKISGLTESDFVLAAKIEAASNS